MIIWTITTPQGQSFQIEIAASQSSQMATPLIPDEWYSLLEAELSGMTGMFGHTFNLQQTTALDLDCVLRQLPGYSVVVNPQLNTARNIPKNAVT